MQTTPRQIVTERTHGEDEGDFRTREVPEETKTELLGYILPLTTTEADHPEHLVCFTDGTMMHLGFHFHQERDARMKRSYKQAFDPSDAPILQPNLTEVKKSIISGSMFFVSATVLSENNDNNQEAFDQLFGRAVTVAHEKLETKRRTQEATMDGFNRRIADLRRKMNPHEQPPGPPQQ